MALGQTKPPAEKKYEVVSIKPVAPGAANSTGGCGFPTSSFTSPANFTINHCSLASLIKMAYDADSPWHLADLPKWTSSAQYDIAAKSAAPVSIGEKYAMLRPVLEERFKLKWHRETRQLPVVYLSARPAASSSRRASLEAAFRSIH